MNQEEGPKALMLVHAAFAVLAINTFVALLFCVSPNLGRATGIKQEPQSYEQMGDKASPFEQAETQKPHKAFRRPPKLEPILAQAIPEVTIPPSGSDN